MNPLREKAARVVAWSAAMLLGGAIGARFLGIGWATVDLREHLGHAERPPRSVAAPGVPTASPAEEEPDPPPPPPGSPEEAEGAHPIEDPHGALGPFLAALEATDAHREGAVTRIGHYGDSILDADLITGVLRRRLQKRFGDAGHGFVLAGTPWPGYRHWDVKVAAHGHWIVNRSTNSPVADGMYGLGGVSFHTTATGSSVAFATDPHGEVGRSASRIEIGYLEHPTGGDLEITGPSGVPIVVSTRAEAPAPGFHAVAAPDGAMRALAKAKGGGDVRIFGAVLERDRPGLVYDALNINGARARILLRFDEAHWTKVLRHRDLDLVILNFGINESEADDLPMAPYREIMTKLVARTRRALPEASCLVVGPMDRAGRDAQGRMRTRPVIRRLKEVQRAVALAGGCAFWDAFAAMGGNDASVRWARLGLIGGDYTHVTQHGGVRFADLFYRALLHAYYARRDSVHGS